MKKLPLLISVLLAAAACSSGGVTVTDNGASTLPGDGAATESETATPDADEASPTITDELDPTASADPPPAATATTAPPISQDLTVFKLEIGDCVQLPDEDRTEVETLTTVSCDAEHDAELYDEFDIPGDDYPGLETVLERASDGCFDRFEAFVGRDYASSDLDFTTLYPTEDSWNRLDDRTVVCVVMDFEGDTLVGTVGGSAR